VIDAVSSLRALRRTLVGSAVLAAAAVALVFATSGFGAGKPTTGVVVIEAALDYQRAAGAGTGVVLTANGEVLTNNHLIRGATRIRVIDPRTRRRYTARVLGYSVSADIAVLQLQQASGLRTVLLGTSTGLRRGQPVTAVGNAGGTSTLVTAHGTITALGRTITAHDERGTAQRLTGLIETDAELRPGDSGGPLLDRAGRVIGIDSAASTGFVFRSGRNEGYAIPIDRALSIRRQIDAGRGTAEIHVGPTAFLGVAVHPSGYYRGGFVPGALVDNVVRDGPADKAGLAPGDIITAIDGKRVSTPSGIARVILLKKPGDTIRLTWVDRFGNRSTASARLVSGPPQ
jgi:S1-C subfamily serine protease